MKWHFRVNDDPLLLRLLFSWSPLVSFALDSSYKSRVSWFYIAVVTIDLKNKHRL